MIPIFLLEISSPFYHLLLAWVLLCLANKKLPWGPPNHHLPKWTIFWALDQITFYLDMHMHIHLLIYGFSISYSPSSLSKLASTIFIESLFKELIGVSVLSVLSVMSSSIEEHRDVCVVGVALPRRNLNWLFVFPNNMLLWSLLNAHLF